MPGLGGAGGGPAKALSAEQAPQEITFGNLDPGWGEASSLGFHVDSTCGRWGEDSLENRTQKQKKEGKGKKKYRFLLLPASRKFL